ncbi:1-deoxy-D-xylulose-5-phosphate synthase [Feifania hominis]|uniref:1-deoxy-D-xylulose-5-phosphate synthase n=1 Tax=Feifania hominis TaxID=2763660 RepID=A0A926HUH1_9FIRM|nr:1-deoxy-D-xylulose-5-phosphate synthase [Feifania hominis]MBC8535551.1 1-deoxy-D-xylulose-5-phosphate synthase [Feifania hominis]
MNHPTLERIDNADKIKAASLSELDMLAADIRSFLIEHISKTGGHLASNLGVVELTIALHNVLNFPQDQVVFDVGHQAYTHKILTGRRDRFDTLRQFQGLSGFPKPHESDCDAFGTGHSSTSISAAVGLATAKKLRGEAGHVVAVIGDGAMTGGLAYEGLNNITEELDNLIIVLNDNELSISKNVGSLAEYLAKLTSKPAYFRIKDATKKVVLHIPLIGRGLYRVIHDTKSVFKTLLVGSNFFEDLGITYFGPIDGHDIKAVSKVLGRAMTIGKPALIHLKTVKGKGYVYAENDPTAFHGIASFDMDTGEHPSNLTDSFSKVFGDSLYALAQQDERICAITAAMTEGVSLCRFAAAMPQRFFDVGIAEGHAVTFAAGLAKAGMRPCFAVYSSFLQRAYDEIVHDVALQNLPVTFLVDRAGIVGEDGETHQGIFDVSYLTSIPNMTVYSPYTYTQLKALLGEMGRCEGPTAIRIPRGGMEGRFADCYEIGDYAVYGREDASAAVVTYGRMTAQALDACEELEKSGIHTKVISLLKIKPIDFDALFCALAHCRKVVFLEESERIGGIAQQLAAELLSRRFAGRYTILALNDTYVEQGKPQQLLRVYGISAQDVVRAIAEEDAGEREEET